MPMKIAGPMRIQSDGATALDYDLDALSGGSRCKVMMFSLRVLRASANCALGFEISQGPDGENYGEPKVLLSLTAVPAGGGVIQFSTGTPDTDAADVLNEWIRPQLRCGVSSGTSDQWAVLEVYAQPLRPAVPKRYASPMQARRDARSTTPQLRHQASSRDGGCTGGCNG